MMLFFVNRFLIYSCIDLMGYKIEMQYLQILT